jgi:hypothetical protein
MRLSLLRQLTIAGGKHFKYFHELPNLTPETLAALKAKDPIPVEQITAEGRKILAASAQKEPGWIAWDTPSTQEGAQRLKREGDPGAYNDWVTYYVKVAGEYYSLYPLLFFMAGACVVGIPLVWLNTLVKGDLYMDKSKKEVPWDWSRAKDNYMKTHETWHPSYKPRMKRPLPDIVVDTQDKMIEAARALGTR